MLLPDRIEVSRTILPKHYFVIGPDDERHLSAHTAKSIFRVHETAPSAKMLENCRGWVPQAGFDEFFDIERPRNLAPRFCSARFLCRIERRAAFDPVSQCQNQGDGAAKFQGQIAARRKSVVAISADLSLVLHLLRTPRAFLHRPPPSLTAVSHAVAPLYSAVRQKGNGHGDRRRSGRCRVRS